MQLCINWCIIAKLFIPDALCSFRFDQLRVLQFRLMQNWWLAIWVLYKFNHRFIIFFVLLTFPLTLFMFPCLPQQWTMSSLVNPCATVTIMAASSTSSCSPPPARHYKRSSREHSVCSPVKKKSSKTPSLDDCLDDLDDILKDARERKSRRITEAEEMARVNQILKADGYSESDLFFAQALNLCTHRLHRRAFLNFETKEGRYNYVKVSWDVMTLKSKWSKYQRLLLSVLHLFLFSSCMVFISTCVA